MIDKLEQAVARPVSRETFEKIDAYADLLRQEAQRQNLISAATLDRLWERHIFDSAQLVRFSPGAHARWVDIGSGAGLPGLVLACLLEAPITLVEPRRLRADFLKSVVSQLGLTATVVQSKVERVSGAYDVITGRAVAPLASFLNICDHLSTRKTVWVLPKGRSAQSELAEARRTWQGSFRVEPSVTDEDSKIIVATEVRAGKR